MYAGTKLILVRTPTHNQIRIDWETYVPCPYRAASYSYNHENTISNNLAEGRENCFVVAKGKSVEFIRLDALTISTYVLMNLNYVSLGRPIIGIITYKIAQFQDLRKVQRKLYYRYDPSSEFSMRYELPARV